MRRARCCCGDGTCTIRFASVNGCTGAAVANAPFSVWTLDGSGNKAAHLFDATTDASGMYTATLPAGGYGGSVSSPSLGSIEYRGSAACDGTVLMPLYSYYVMFNVRGCQPSGYTGELVGSEISITGPQSAALVTDSNGLFQWHPMLEGNYSYSITHPSGRFKTATGTFVVASRCPGTVANVTVNLVPKDGYTCCYPTSTTSPTDNLPSGKILVTTSAGDSWMMDGCESVRCTSTEDIPLGGPITTGTVSSGGLSCSYSDFPEITIGRATVMLKINVANRGSATAYLSDPIYQNSTQPATTLRRLDPMTYANCRYHTVPPSPELLGRFWYLPDGGCPNVTPGFPYQTAAPTVHSVNPLSITLTFPDPANAAWTWRDPYYGGVTRNAPMTLKTVTLTEILP